MTNHEQVIMAMTSQEHTQTQQTVESESIHDTHEISHDHSHDHDHGHDHSHEHHDTDGKLTIRQRLGRWAVGKSGIMQNQHVENITAATCCGAVCRGDLPVVAAYVATTAFASIRTPKEKTESESK